MIAPKQQSDEEDRFEVLITAQEAWPAFERAVLRAKREVQCGFRVFDPSTALRNPEAQAVGSTWFDLLAHVLRKGVRVRMVLSDFDPVLATALHEMTWRTKRQMVALKEIVGPEAAKRLEVVASLHPARAGLLPRTFFMPAVLQKMKNQLDRLSPARLKREAVGLNASDWPRLHTVTHHQKLAVIDRETCYIGGLDLNERRFDTKQHEQDAHQTWSDVQVIVRGPEAEEAAQHLERFLDQIEKSDAGKEGTFLRRTLSSPRQVAFWRLSPKTIAHEIEDDHIAAFHAARHLLHIETQYFRSRKLAGELSKAASNNPDLGLILVLPSLPEEVIFDGHKDLDARYGLSLQSECIEMIKDAFGSRACITSPVQPRFAAREDEATLAGSPVIHVHNKVLVQDDEFALIGSANLNGRSMRWDTEVALRVTLLDRVRRLREALYSHWWFKSPPLGAFELSSAVSWWNDEVRRNGLRRPEARTGFLVPHDPDQLSDFRQPLPGVTEDIV